jgi:hypothetical protein
MAKAACKAAEENQAENISSSWHIENENNAMAMACSSAHRWRIGSRSASAWRRQLQPHLQRRAVKMAIINIQRNGAYLIGGDVRKQLNHKSALSENTL